jgi:hypothetical protein
MNLYLLLVWNDVEPDIAGPYQTPEHRDTQARLFREEYGEDTGIYMLDIDNQGNPYSGAYSGGFFEQGAK